ncbi:unnamed protein product [Prorocentrum cordatum]|uniref:Uncharacterized protein n=1 Tax=Prorocentrum cordatum TaxID=2364126 RepID=A0ABN9TIY1_9DINO|nr:unnamed protein product [Polarella glacialis]
MRPGRRLRRRGRRRRRQGGEVAEPGTDRAWRDRVGPRQRRLKRRAGDPGSRQRSVPVAPLVAEVQREAGQDGHTAHRGGEGPLEGDTAPPGRHSRHALRHAAGPAPGGGREEDVPEGRGGGGGRGLGPPGEWRLVRRRRKDVPRTLERVLKSAPFPLVASTVAGLGERGAEGEEMRECAAFVGRSPAPLEALPAPLLLRLTVAATKSGAVAEGALDAVASAAALTLPGWNMDDVSKLLLAVAKARPRRGAQGSRDGVAELYRRSHEVLPVKLSEFSSVQLIKVLLAIGQAAECRPLMEAVALHAAETRLGPELPAQQVQLLTQGLVPLGGGHAAVVKALDFWAAQLNEATRAENLLTESMGDDMVKQRRKDLEAKGQLNADQLAKLANTLAPHAAKHQDLVLASAHQAVCGARSVRGHRGRSHARGQGRDRGVLPWWLRP